MNYDDILKLILIGFWTPIIFILAGYLYWRIMTRRYTRYRDFPVEEKFEEMLYKTSREVERISEIIPEMVDSRLEKLSGKLSNTLESTLDRKLTKSLETFKTDISPKLDIAKFSQGQDSSSSATIMREISHSLNTPLSQIEAANLSMKELYKSKDLGIFEFSDYTSAIQSSLNICKSFLAAYRELVLVASSSSFWSPKSLTSALSSAFDVYKRKENKNLTLSIDISEDIPGYSNNYLISVLLPLIENAVESSGSDNEVKIVGQKSNSIYIISVINATKEPPTSDVIYDDSYTTKPSHEGMSLSIVKHLISSNRNASISHKVDSNLVTFQIKLPIGD